MNTQRYRPRLDSDARMVVLMSVIRATGVVNGFGHNGNALCSVVTDMRYGVFRIPYSMCRITNRLTFSRAKPPCTRSR